ncbi:hypothetical protein [Halorussus litoreus]|uniref:hypothetical protein n=1 Tax=Halorussus litoreus TaxID=1710536 RepID=UPI0018E5692A|nr:hypothetical protein [Halorussus litoreus]
MTDSNARDRLAEKHQKNRQQRVEAVKRWVRYVKKNPPEKWGEQQNRVIDSQLRAARESNVSAEQYRRVERAGEVREHERTAEGERNTEDERDTGPERTTEDGP